MSSKKVERALYGPSWTEVILGAALSFILGVVLAAALLIVRPIETVRELPKEPVKGTIYYIEGAKDSGRGRLGLRKREQLIAGTSVTLSEDELNAIFVAAAGKPSAPAEKGKAEAPAASEGYFGVGAPNFRVVEKQVQVGVPCTLNVYGFKVPVQVVAAGGFVKTNDGFIFVPETYYLGSLAIQHLPVLGGAVTRKILAAQAVPDDLAAAWKKLSDVSVEGKSLKLTM